jgi:transposase InsO family protein
VKALQLDNEFKSKELESYLTEKGIVTRYSSPYTPEQNGAAEIINRVLLNKVRALLINSNLPKKLWGEAILTATYLYNRTPNSSINFKTPYYLKYNKMPNLEHIRVFGSLAYYKEPSSFITKLDSKATPYYLVGFIGSNIYKLCNPTTNKTNVFHHHVG